MPQITNHSAVFQGFPCEICFAIFTRKSDRDRHEKRHLPRSQWAFKCDSCTFTANQSSGLTCHMNSVHLKKRIRCRDPACDRDFSDPATLSRHMSRCHMGRRHKLPSKKRNPPPWIGLTNSFSARKAKAPVDAAVADGPSIRNNSGRITKVERRSPDVSSAGDTLHTSLFGQEEGFPCDPILDLAHFSFAPSPTLSPLLGSTYQPDRQFQSSDGFYPSGSGIDFPCFSTTMSLPKTNLNDVLPPYGFQIDVGMPDAYGTLPSAGQSVDPYFVREMPVDDFIAQTSSFAMAPAYPILPCPSLMVPPPMINYNTTSLDSDLLREASHQWHFGVPARNSGYGDACGPEYYSTFDGLSPWNF